MKAFVVVRGPLVKLLSPDESRLGIFMAIRVIRGVFDWSKNLWAVGFAQGDPKNRTGK